MEKEDDSDARPGAATLEALRVPDMSLPIEDRLLARGYKKLAK
jgi:hypothetical protein